MKTKSRQRAFFTSYSEYLQADHWQEMKRKLYQKYTHQCEICHKRRPEAHHLRYDHLGQDREWRDLVPLCRTHHLLCHFALFGWYKIPLTPRHLLWRYRLVKWNKLGRLRPSTVLNLLSGLFD